MHTTRTARRGWRRFVAGASLLAVATTMFASMASASTSGDVTDGQLEWGFRQNFRNYVGRQTAALPPIGALPVGERITLIGSAQWDLDGTPAWPESPSDPNETLPYLLEVTGGTVTSDDDLTITTGGGAAFHFPSHGFETEVENVSVVVEDGEISLRGDLTVEIVENAFGITPGTYGGTDILLGAAASGSVTLDAGQVTVSGTGVTLSAEGSAALQALLPVGADLDDFTVTANVEATEEPEPEPFSVTVTPTTGLADEDTVSVDVSGIPDGQGIYLMFCIDVDGRASGDQCKGGSSQVWVTPSGQSGTQHPDNSPFTLPVMSQFKGHDCREVVCGVQTRRDHYGTSDFSLDSFTPVSFAPVGEQGDQDIEVTVPEPEPEPGEFVWSIDNSSGAASLGTAAVNGDHLLATGAINPILVTDTRLGGLPWSISAQVSDFTSGSDTFPGQYLGWTPQVVSAGAGAAAGDPVASGFGGGDGLSAASELASAGAGHELGSAELGAGLELRLPLDTTPGDYAATLTVTALS